MLNILEQKSADGAKAYFNRADYLSEGQELVGEWRGNAAESLGLRGTVDKNSFDLLCDNINPQTGESLTKSTREGRRVGYDFTWSAPKSVSVVHALTRDEAVLTAFRNSIRETMTDMEAEFKARVRKGGQEWDRTTGNWCVAEFVHLTSRPVNEVPCPQMHMHAFVFNATHDHVEDQWKAGQFGDLKRDAYYWQAVQQARFANKLQEAGYSVSRTKDAFEITGVPKSVLDKFSLRTKVIEEAADRLGIVNPKSKAKLGATTREKKNDRYTHDDLVKKWDERLTASERAAVHGAFKEQQPQKVEMRNAEHARYAVDHSFERSSVVEERRLLTLGLRHGCGEVTPEGIKAEADRCKLLKRIEDGRTWVTTKDVLAEESRMIAFAVKGRATMRPLISQIGSGGELFHNASMPIELSRSTAKVQSNSATLSSEQQAVIRHVLTSKDRVMLVRGAAGTGKSTLTKEAVERIEEGGHPVLMLAPTTAAVDVLLRDGHSAYTLAEFVVSDKVSQQARGGVIWVDEASLVGTKSMAALFDKAKEIDARVVLMGDKRQMGSIERGSSLRVLEDIAKLPVAEVADIRRQSGAYKDAMKLLSKGRALEGFDKLDALGWVKPLDSYDQVAKDYADKIEKARKPEDAAIIVCPTHREGAKIVEAVRGELKDRGVISEEDREFRQLVSTQWTEAQRGDKDQYTGEESLRFNRRGYGFEAGDEVKASAVDLAKLKPAHFTAFNERSIRVSKGDMIRLTGNGNTEDKHKLRNGTVYKVDGFDKDGRIILENGWKLEKDFGQFTHAYVSTYFAAQGRTCDHSIVVQGEASLPAVSQEGFYVAASRGRKSCTVYTQDPQELREAIEKNREKLTATELVAKPKPQQVTRLAKAAARMRAVVIAAKRAVYETIHTPTKENNYANER